MSAIPRNWILMFRRKRSKTPGGSLRLGDYEFRHVTALEVERDRNGKPLKNRPQPRYSKASVTKLHLYGDGEFCRFTIPNDPPLGGVYVITSEGRPQYVGECVDLSKRYNTGYGNISPRNCFEGGQQTNCRINKLVLAEAAAGRRLDLWFFETANRKQVEARLIRSVRPPWNRTS